MLNVSFDVLGFFSDILINILAGMGLYVYLGRKFEETEEANLLAFALSLLFAGVLIGIDFMEFWEAFTLNFYDLPTGGPIILPQAL